MLHKDWYSGVTQLLAEEADGIARLLRLGILPGLFSPTGHADLAKPTISGTKILFHAFNTYDAIVTGGSVCESYYTDEIDFATAGPSGGPLAAGDYQICLAVRACSEAAKRYECYPLPALTSVTINQQVYLVVVSTVTWNGSTTLSAMTDARTAKWGGSSLGLLGRGIDDEVQLGTERDWRFACDVCFDGDVFGGNANFDTLLSIGSLAGGGTLALFDGSTILSGGISWTPTGVVALTPGTGGSFDITLGAAGKLTVAEPPGGDPNHEGLVVNGRSSQGANGVDQRAGDTFFLSGSQILIEDGSLTQIGDAATIKFESGAFAAKPARNQFTGAAPLKAWAVILADGTIQDSFNIYSCTKTGTGEYTLVYRREFYAGTSGAVVCSPLQNAAAYHAVTDGQTAGGCVIQMYNDSHAAADCAFLVIVAGGDQAADPA